MNKIINEFYVPFTRKSIPMKNCGKVRLLLDDGWNGDISHFFIFLRCNATIVWGSPWVFL